MKRCKTMGCYSDAVCSDGRCGEHTTATKNKQNYSRRSYPRKDVPHLGVEIECIASSTTAHKLLLSQSKAPCYDGSLGDFGCEFKICKPVKQTITTAAKLAERLASCGAIVNSKCGLHVHIDARRVIKQRRHDLLAWLEAWQEWWFNLMPESRRNSRYVQRLHGPITYYDHFTWAHITSYDTIEIRLHGGSLNPHKITGWLNAMADLGELLRSDFPLPAINGEPTQDQLEDIFPSTAGRQYVKDRKRHNGTLTAAQATSNGIVSESE